MQRTLNICAENKLMQIPFGFVVIDKPQGLTSHDCVNRLRKIFHIKRVGHGGTLDPDVTGVLPIALGNATRLLNLLPSEKKYSGTIQLGYQTSTDDTKGEVISHNKWPLLTKSCLKKALNSFSGTIKQRPPKVSSIHIQGERAYKKARRGEFFLVPERTVIVHDISLTNWNQDSGKIEINIHCSSGTYIRSIARDLGTLLGCGGCLARLRRTEALGFGQEVASKLPSLNNDNELPQILSPINFLRHLNFFHLENNQELSYWQTGRNIITPSRRVKIPSKRIIGQEALEKLILVIDCYGQMAGIGELVLPSTIKPKIVFNAKG